MKIKNIKTLLGCILICELAGFVGALFSISAIPTWYVTLAKPILNPPSWVFGPVWTILYALMGISLYLVLQQGHEKENVKTVISSKVAVKIFFVQLLLNAIWSIIFFGLKNTGLALFDILAMWLAIVTTIFTFYKISKPASYLLLPYLAWVSFATYLNYSIWILN